jgi:hypothetical protein
VDGKKWIDGYVESPRALARVRLDARELFSPLIETG